MAAAAGKKESVSLSLFMDVTDLEVEEALSTMATLAWAEGTWQAWRQPRELAGAAMCETCDLGIKWPWWHTLVFEGQETVDMGVIFPEFVKKMLLRKA